jgi:hypothetical protein
MEAIDTDLLQVDVRRALENELAAPLASIVFHSFLLAHGEPETLSRDQAADLFCRLLFAPETVAPALVTRFAALYRPAYEVHPYRRAHYVLPVLEALYYREDQERQAASEQTFSCIGPLCDERS